ncbi:hypothetical protein NLI96_g5016 [Meripilus lineatus]|uniref:Uncharacterized protein n=1 Tax=Meripilus lineatus TaxID=2056292 RepID=A0AAD5V5W0_9APHY|nr:hypothetical protein NLI96_g5016 [Physisporinus lineatus]
MYYSRPKRLRLYDRRSVVGNLEGSGLPKSDNITAEPKRFMAIITAPVLLNGGRQTDRGFFCAGCQNEFAEAEGGKNFRVKYLAKELSEHIARFGRVVEHPKIPNTFVHATEDQITS